VDHVRARTYDEVLDIDTACQLLGFLEQDDVRTLVHHPAFQVLVHFLALGGIMFVYRGIC
jgi:hypothetical protein